MMYQRKRGPSVKEAIKRQEELIRSITKTEKENDYTVSEVRSLLEIGGVDPKATDLNLKNYYQSLNYRSPLHYAVSRGATRTTELLLKHEADPNVADRFEVTPLHLAADQGHAMCIKQLLEAGAKINAKTRYRKEFQLGSIDSSELSRQKMICLSYPGGSTALHLAASRNHTECVRCLMWEGADYNADNEEGETCLYLACARGNAESAQALLDNAISQPILALPTKRGDTPLHACLRAGERMRECVKKLVAHGSDVSFRSLDWETPIHLALTHHWSEDIISLFLLQGYGMDFDKNPGRSPLDLVVYGEPGNQESRVMPDQHMAVLFVQLGASRKLLDVLSYELRNNFEKGPLLDCVMETFAFLPPLKRVLAREPREHARERGQFGYAATLLRTGFPAVKQDFYKSCAAQFPSLRHLSRCAIRSVMGTRIRFAKALPLPQNIKEYLLLGFKLSDWTSE